MTDAMERERPTPMVATSKLGGEDPEALKRTQRQERLNASENPFRMPQDEEIFNMREKEKAERRQHNEDMHSLPVADKTTCASRMAATVNAATKANGLPPRRQAGAAKEEGRTLAAGAVPQPRPRQNRERVSEFIAKKREIFLVQMSLDIKRTEIRKLEERVLQREDALKKSEEMLESDAVKFDQFLRENEAKVNETIKAADNEAKRRGDKQIEIKRIDGKIASMRSELNKREEQLAECERHRQFLDDITPTSHFETQQRAWDARRGAAMAAWAAECAAVRQEKVDAAAAKEQAEADYVNARTQQEADRATEAVKASTAHLKAVLPRKEPPPPEEEPEETHDQEMHFQRPSQLLDILYDLEEQNLFLIQNAQEVEEELDAVESTYKRTQAELLTERNALSATAATLEQKIAEEEEALEVLHERTQDASGAARTLFNHEVSLDALTSKVSSMYRQCGFDADPSASTLQMLTNIEMRMEEYLKGAERLPGDAWEVAEKTREKERRHEARDLKVTTTKEEQERRLKKALERAAAPVYRKAGKPVMFRSQPVRKPKPVKVDTRDEDQVELETFLAREML